MEKEVELTREKYETIKELSRLEKEELELAVDVIDENDNTNFPEEIKGNLANAKVLIEEVIDFYELIDSQSFEEFKQEVEDLPNE